MLELTIATLRYMDAAATAVAANGAVLPIPPGARAPDYATALAEAASVDPGTAPTPGQGDAIAAAKTNVAALLDAVPAAARPAPPDVSGNAKNVGRPSLALTKALFARATAAQPWTLPQVKAAEVEAACAAEGVSPTANQVADIADARGLLGSPATVDGPHMLQTPLAPGQPAGLGGLPEGGTRVLTKTHVEQIAATWHNLRGMLVTAGILPP